MTRDSLRAVFLALNGRRVRYLIVGGLAVNAHGSLRFTMDVDLVVQLKSANLKRAFAALASLGYRPGVPVTADAFADRSTREGWIRDKGMRVLQFYSDQHRDTPVDVFVSEPFDFDAEYKKALKKTLDGTSQARFVSLPTLIQMKAAAGRSKDLVDLEDLRLKMKS